MKKIQLLLPFSLLILSACTTSSGSEDMSPRTLGDLNSRVVIDEFSDPQCPACGAISPMVEQLIRENPDLARLNYYNFPLSYHEHAFISAEAAECAGDQGKFFEYLGTLFRNQNSLSEDFLYSVADSLDLDRTKFDACLQNHDKKAKILAQIAEGQRRGLPGTPTFYVNGQQIQWSGVDTFKAYLESL